MLSRGLQIFLSVAIFICSTLAGMAQETISEEVRADLFVANELGEQTDKHEDFTWEDAAILPSTACAPQSVTPVKNFKNEKRNHKRVTSFKINHSKCRISTLLSPAKLSKGVARHPRNQDAQQERTAADQFLQIAALAC